MPPKPAHDHDQRKQTALFRHGRRPLVPETRRRPSRTDIFGKIRQPAAQLSLSGATLSKRICRRNLRADFSAAAAHVS